MKKTVMVGFCMIAVGSSACGKLALHRTSSLRQNAGGLPPFAHILKHDISPIPFSDNIDSFISVARSGAFTLETDEYINSWDQPVILWFKSSASVKTHGQWIGWNYTIYDSQGEYGISGLKILHTEDGVSETQAQGETWKPVIVKPGESIQVSWIMDLSSGFLLCTSGNEGMGIGEGGRGDYNIFQVSGTMSREIRVTPMGIEEPEATGPADHLNSARVYLLEKEDNQPLINSSAGAFYGDEPSYSKAGLCHHHT